MTPISIHAALKEAGYTMSDVARRHGVTPSTVRKVIHGEGKSREIAKTVATLIGKTPNEVWPGKYPARYERGSNGDLMAIQARMAAALSQGPANSECAAA